MNIALNILIIEDTTADFLLIERHLHKNGLAAHCSQVTNLSELSADIANMKWDVVLSDYNVPGLVFTESVALIRRLLPDIPIILVSGTVGEEKAVDLLKQGVTDFILKDNLARMVPAITRALHEVAELRAKQAVELALREKDQLLREMSSLAHIGGWEYNPATQAVSWTEEVAGIHELDPLDAFDPQGTLLTTNLTFSLDFFEAESQRKMEAALQQATADGRGFDLELEMVTAKGNRKWVRTVGVPVRDEKRVVKIRGAIQDITDRKHGEMMLFEQKERAQVTLHSIGDAVITTDGQGIIDYLNPVAEALTGWKRTDAINKPLMTVFNIVDETSKQPLPSPILSLLQNGDVNYLSAACQLVRPDSSFSLIEDSAAAIRNRDGGIIGTVLVFRDVTATREISARIAHQATHDALTGLPNRVLSWDRLQHAISTAQREGNYVGVLFLDLDRFKNINDSLGHGAGDEVLKQVAARLVSATRSVDTVSRQGGDEFIIIIPGAMHKMQFAQMAKKILRSVLPSYYVNQNEISMTFSIGISSYPHDGDDADTLIKNADAAMYHAKKAGRDTYRFYTEAMNSKAAQHLTLEAQLRHAVTRDELVVHYQPKIEVTNGKLIGAEALLRWNHQQFGLLSPSNFIGIAEESGLITEIGHWVAQEVCRQNQAWLQDGLACIPISVNLSAMQFRNRSLVDSLRTILRETGLPPKLLELELTESIIMHDVESVITTLHKLKDLGVNLSIDDFGTGYSSLSYLRRFPIDTLKIDQSFMKDITTDESDAAIIKAIISMAHSLRMRVIAEGVETREQFRFLEANHCDEIQGFYFSQPVPASAFEALLKSPKLFH